MPNQSTQSNSQTYATGEQVEEDGTYVCVPCGYQKELTKGDTFPSCVGCIDKDDVLDEEEGTWEKRNNPNQ